MGLLANSLRAATWLCLVLTLGCNEAAFQDVPDASAVPEEDREKQLLSVTPSVGPNTGGIKLTLRGTDFVAGIKVRIGGTDTQPTLSSDQELTAALPARPATVGPVPIELLYPDGFVRKRSDLFSYYSDALDFQAIRALSFGSTLSAISSAVVADFDKNGRKDVAVLSPNDGRLLVVMNQPEGFEQTPRAFAASGFSGRLNSEDFDGNGTPDLFYIREATAFPPVTNISVFLGDGTGGFGVVKNTTLSVSTITSSVSPRYALGDMTGDGKVDLAYIMDTSLYVVSGDGTGGFGTASSFPLGLTPGALTLSDMDGDGRPDAVITLSSGSDVYVFRNQGMAGLLRQGPFPAGASALVVRIADVNGDQRPDILAQTATPTRTFNILLANGTGGYSLADPIPYGTTAPKLLTADFNQDGKTDLILVGGSQLQIEILLGDGSGKFSREGNITYAGATAPAWAEVADLNADGTPDVIAATSSLRILLGDGAGRFLTAPFVEVSGNPKKLIVQDQDGDGRSDAVIFSQYDPAVTILSGDGKGLALKSPPLRVGDGAVTGALADLNRDNKLDLVYVSTNDNIYLSLGIGPGQYDSPRSLGVGNDPTDILVEDVNKDAIPDLVIANSRSKSLGTLLNDGQGNFGLIKGTSISLFEPGMLASGDFDRDGRTDFVVAYTALSGSSSGLVLVRNAGGYLDGANASSISGTEIGARAIVSSDLNGDGWLDVVAAGNDRQAIAINDRRGGFLTFRTPPPAMPGPLSVLALMAADLNGDGWPDLILADSGIAASIQVQLNDGLGNFTRMLRYAVPDTPAGLGVADFDRDSRPDIAVLASTGNSARVYVLYNRAK